MTIPAQVGHIVCPSCPHPGRPHYAHPFFYICTAPPPDEEATT
jgi:hypothetical protein